MLGTWVVTIPPLLVVLSVLLTRHMIFSFIVGILSGAFIASQGDIFQTLVLSVKRVWENTGLASLTSVQGFFSSWNLLIFLFLITLGIIIELLAHSGAAQAYTTLVSTKVKNKKGVEIASLILSLFFFIDDYFSALTVGSVMKPLGQMHSVHPVKLAFLATTMATPLVIIAPLSSWVGQIILQLKQSGIGPESPTTRIAADPYLLFLYSIPFILYALILIVSTWYIVLRRISYGPMQKYDEYKNPQTQNIPIKSVVTKNTASIFDFLFPLGILIGGVFLMLLYTGNFYLFGGTETFFESLKSGNVQQAFFVSGLTCLLMSFGFFLFKGTLTVQDGLLAFKSGFKLMFPSIVMLTCAWALGTIIKEDLQTGRYIASIIATFINLALFPLLCFLFATLIAWMIGSAWATMALMFPIVIDLFGQLLHLVPNTPLSEVSVLIPIVGATLSGCVFGTQLSFISDNPIMSAASTGAPHLEHLKTMSWYIIPVGISAALCFIFLGITAASWGLSISSVTALIGGIFLSLMFLELANYFFARRS